MIAIGRVDMSVFNNTSMLLFAVLITVLTGICVPDSRADVIVPSGQMFVIGEPVPDRTFSTVSLELLDRFDRTYAIHGLQLVGSWHGSLRPDSHSPVGLSAGDLVAEVCLPHGNLFTHRYGGTAFARVHAGNWEHAGMGVQLLDQPFYALSWFIFEEDGSETDESAQLAAELKIYSMEVTAGLAVVAD